MKKMYLKYKILINGLNPVGEYEIDGFSIKETKFEENIFKPKYENDKNGINFNMNLYLMSCLTGYENLFYKYFETNEFVEIEVSNETNKDNLDKV